MSAATKHDPRTDGQEPIRHRFALVPFGKIALSTTRRDLVRGVIPRVGLTVVWGPPKSGKSFWMFDAAMHVALGWPYRGRRVHPGQVVYCAFEGQSGLEARVAAFRSRFLAEDAEPPFYLQPTTLNLIAQHEELIAAIKDQGVAPVLVVLDTLNRSLAGSESSDEDMSAYVAAADRIRDAFSCAVVVVHHCGIDGSRPRGHTALTGAVEAQIAIKRDAAGNIRAEVELAKDGPQGDIITSALEVVEVGLDEDGEPIRSCVVVPADASEEAGPRPSGQTFLALKLLRRAIDETGKPAPPRPEFPAGSRTTDLASWRLYCDQGSLTTSDDPDTRRRTFVRHSQKLQALGLVRIWAEQVCVIEPSRTRRTIPDNG